jgi:transposase
VDEISVGQGQTYWHLVSALEGPRGPELLFIGEGRKERHLAKFWKWFGKDRARGISHGVIDMWKPFRNSFLAKCPEAKIIYDKFHVIQHLLKTLNNVRKQELGKAAGRFRGLLEGKKFILLSRRAHVRGNGSEYTVVRQPQALQSPSAEGILRPPLVLLLQDLGHEILPSLGGSTQVESSEALS